MKDNYHDGSTINYYGIRKMSSSKYFTFLKKCIPTSKLDQLSNLHRKSITISTKRYYSHKISFDKYKNKSILHGRFCQKIQLHKLDIYSNLLENFPAFLEAPKNLDA